MSEPPVVGIIMGSRSDWETMRHAAETLDELGVPYEKEVVSAHRTPDKLFAYAEAAEARGLQVIIAGGGWSRAPSRHDLVEDAAPGARRSGRVEGAAGARLAPLDRADAGRESRSGRSRSGGPGRSTRHCSRPRSWRAQTRACGSGLPRIARVRPSPCSPRPIRPA